MLHPDYTFFVFYDSVETQVFPTVNTLLFQDTKDGNFDAHRRSLETELIFDNKGDSEDFTFLYAIHEASPCALVEFRIKYKGVTKYPALLRFGSEGIRFNLSKCTVSAKLDIDDEYYCLFSNWEREIDILDGTTKYEVFTSIGEIEEVICTKINEVVYEPFVSDCLPDNDGWVVKKHEDAPLIGTSHEHKTTWVREKVTIGCSGGDIVEPPGGGWIMITDNCPTNTTWVREPRRVFDAENSSLDESSEILISIWKITNEELPEKFTNAVSLKEVLEDFNPCAGTVKSNFFSINPDGTNPDNDAYTEAEKELANVLIFQKTDIKNFSFSNPALDGLWTFKAIIEHLIEQFNVDFRIISGDLIIEHVSYFEKSQGFDFTQPAYAKSIEGLDEFSYDNSKVARFEKWTFQEKVSSIFAGRAIEYDCVGEDDQSEIVHPLEDINNDIAYIIENTDDIDNDGFIFINAFKDDLGDYYLTSELSELNANALVINGHLSIPNLQQNYWRWQRPLPDGTMNESPISFESSINRKTQVELTIKLPRADYHDSFNPNDLVKTQFGWAEIESARYDARTCDLTIIPKHA